MVGLPKSYIKKYGITKKAWSEYRKSKSKSKRTTTTRKNNPKGKNMGKRRETIQGLMKRVVLPLAPHLLSNSGVAGMGYSVIQSGLTLQQRVQNLATNELMLFTGYDAKARNWKPHVAAVNYGAVIIPKVVSYIKNRILR